MGGGRGENCPHVWPHFDSSESQGGGYIQSIDGFVTSVTSRPMKCFPPCRSLTTATVWYSEACLIIGLFEYVVSFGSFFLPSTQTSRTMMSPSMYIWWPSRIMSQ